MRPSRGGAGQARAQKPATNSHAKHGCVRSAAAAARTAKAGPRLKGKGRLVCLATASSKLVERQTVIDQFKKTRLITALKTPYLESGKFDLEAYDNLVARQIEQGVEGVIVGGTTGEGQLMSWDEHIMLIAHTVHAFGKQIKVIGNTGSNSTREALHATEQGFNVGMHASLQINPYYGKTSHEGLMKHFERVLDVGPAMLYNVPPRTAQDIPTHMVESLSRHRNFVGIKECAGNERVEYYASKNISCWSGNDDQAHDARHHAGAVGVVSVASNIIPGVYSKLMGDKTQPDLNAKIQDFVTWLFAEPNPIGVNTCLTMAGMAKPVFRLPYTPYGREMQQRGLELMQDLGEEVLGLDQLRIVEDGEFTILDFY